MGQRASSRADHDPAAAAVGGETLRPRDRLLRVLTGETVDRPAILCPGGPLSAVTRELLQLELMTLRDLASQPRLQAWIAQQSAERTGFESIGLPLFAHTEAETLGSMVEWTDDRQGPRLAREAFASIREWRLPPASAALKAGWMATTLAAMELLGARGRMLPLLGNITAPLTLLAELVEPTALATELHSDREAVHRALAELTDLLVIWAKSLMHSGAEVLVIHEGLGPLDDPTGAIFEEFAVLYMNRLLDQLDLRGARVILSLDSPKRRRIGPAPLVPLPSRNLPYLLVRSGFSGERLALSSPAQIRAWGNSQRTPRAPGLIVPEGGLAYTTSLDKVRAFTAALRQEEP